MYTDTNWLFLMHLHQAWNGFKQNQSFAIFIFAGVNFVFPKNNTWVGCWRIIFCPNLTFFGPRLWVGTSVSQLGIIFPPFYAPTVGISQNPYNMHTSWKNIPPQMSLPSQVIRCHTFRLPPLHFLSIEDSSVRWAFRVVVTVRAFTTNIMEQKLFSG